MYRSLEAAESTPLVGGEQPSRPSYKRSTYVLSSVCALLVVALVGFVASPSAHDAARVQGAAMIPVATGPRANSWWGKEAKQVEHALQERFEFHTETSAEKLAPTTSEISKKVDSSFSTETAEPRAPARGRFFKPAPMDDFMFPALKNYKWTITKVRGQKAEFDGLCGQPGCLVQVNEMRFYKQDGTTISAGDVGVKITTDPGTHTRATEEPDNLFDGIQNNKFLDLSFTDTGSTVIHFEFDEPIAIAGFDYLTGPKWMLRDPVSWEFSENAEQDQEVLVTSSDMEITENRLAWAGPFMFPVPPSPPPADDPPMPVMEGVIHTDYPVADMAGWTKVLDVPYSHPSVTADTDLCSGYKYMALGCKASPDSTVLSAIAFDEYDWITTVPLSTSLAFKNPAMPNGAYWTFYPGKSIGFAPSEQVSLNSADVNSMADPMRISWHFDNSNVGGWRCGGNTGLNYNGQFHKVMYCRNDGAEPVLPPAPALPEPSPESALQENYPESNFAAWDKVLDVPYSHASVSPDFQACAGYEWIAVGCKSSAASSVLDVVAVEKYSWVTNVPQDRYSAAKNPDSPNGAYWTYYPTMSVGFAPSAAVSLNQADTTDTNDPRRLSWHFDLGNVGGWRCGSTIGLNGDANYRKLIYCKNGSPAPPAPAPAPAAMGTNVPVSDYASWTTVLDQPYAHPSVTADVQLCAGYQQMAIGCKTSAGASTFALIASDDYAFITGVQPSTYEAFKNPASPNGAYWTYYSGKSIGFAPTSTVQLSSADVADMGSTERLSWHFDNVGAGGWRCGSNLWLNSDQSFRKVILCK